MWNLETEDNRLRKTETSQERERRENENIFYTYGEEFKKERKV